MSNPNLSKLVVWITIIQFICTIAFYVYTVIRLSPPKSEEPNFTTEYAAKTANYVKGLEAQYDAKMVRYQEKVDSLNSRAFATQILLSKAKAASARDREMIKELVSQKWDSLSPEQKLHDCDTLRDLAEHYLATTAKKDSVYEEKIKQLEEVEHVLTQQVVTCDTTHDRLKEKLDTSLELNRWSAKEIKKQKRRKIFFKVTTAVLGAFGIYQVVK
jgi:hypothetical protein